MKTICSCRPAEPPVELIWKKSGRVGVAIEFADVKLKPRKFGLEAEAVMLYETRAFRALLVVNVPVNVPAAGVLPTGERLNVAFEKLNVMSANAALADAANKPKLRTTPRTLIPAPLVVG